MKKWQLKPEQSTGYKKIGKKVGIEAKTWGQRGAIMTKFMPKLEKFEAEQFSKKCQKIELRSIPIYEGGKLIGTI